jgi:hypothetical protein
MVIAFTFSCKNTKESVKIKTDYSYFPLIIGNWITYNVTEITIDAISNYYDTTNYQIKELCESVFTDNSGNLCYRIERYKRINETSPWQIKNVWVSKLFNNEAIKTEENFSYVKILFPAEINKTWNGNVYNTGDYLGYIISGINNKENINNMFFDSVLTVIQQDDENLLEKHYSVEKYVKHTGLAYRQNINIESMFIIPGEPYYKRIKSGTIYLQQIIGNGIK